MTNGSSQGYIGNDFVDCQKYWRMDRRKMSRNIVCMAVFAALHPAFSHAAEEAWPEATIQPTARPIQAAAPLAPDTGAVQLAPAETYNSQEPLPPGAGPTNEIDTVAIGNGGGAADFWKPEIHAGITTSVVFDDNIFITHAAQVSDTILVASARVTLAFGDVQSWAARFIDTTARALSADDAQGTDNLIALTYAPTASYFMDNHSQNTVDHDLAGTARWNFGKLQMAFDGRLQTLSDPDDDLAQRVDRTVTTLNLAVNYYLSEKTRVEVSTNYVSRDYKIAKDSTHLYGDAYFLYAMMPKTTVGIGLGGGQLRWSDGISETFERASVRLQYDSFSKLTFNCKGGAELRQTVGGGDEVNGFFEIGATYNPSDTAALFASAYKRIEPSANNQSQSIQRTSFSLGYNQRLFQKLTLSTNLDYTFADYTAAEGNVNANRSDDLLSISATLAFEVTQNGIVRLAYIYRQNDSTLENVSYDENQIILSLTALF